MASRGIVRTGEAFCLSCHQQVDKNAIKCPGCLSELTGEVKAFRCPKCQQIVALGEPQCSKCELKFKCRHAILDIQTEPGLADSTGNALADATGAAGHSISSRVMSS